MSVQREQNEWIELLEKADGTWEELFWNDFDSATMSIDEKSEKKLKTKGHYQDKTFRRWWCIIYWFKYYAKRNYGFDFIHIIDGKYALLGMLDKPSVMWEVWFENNGGKMFVPYVLINQNNRDETLYLR